MSEFKKGQWHALDRVLNLLNTFEDRVVTKKLLYAKIMEMRPDEECSCSSSGRARPS